MIARLLLTRHPASAACGAVQGFLEEVDATQPPPPFLTAFTLNVVATMPVVNIVQYMWIVDLFGSFLCAYINAVPMAVQCLATRRTGLVQVQWVWRETDPWHACGRRARVQTRWR